MQVSGNVVSCIDKSQPNPWATQSVLCRCNGMPEPGHFMAHCIWLSYRGIVGNVGKLTQGAPEEGGR